MEVSDQKLFNLRKQIFEDRYGKLKGQSGFGWIREMEEEFIFYGQGDGSQKIKKKKHYNIINKTNRPCKKKN